MLLPVPVLLPDQGWALRPAQVEAVFPFHLVLDRDLRVLQAGSSVRRLQGDGLVGATFTDQFRVTTPRVAMTFEALDREAPVPLPARVPGHTRPAAARADPARAGG